MSTPISTTSNAAEPAALLQTARGALTDAYLSMTELARNGADRARAATAAARDTAQRARERSISHVRLHPVQSVLIAAGIGAGVAALADWLARRPR